MPKYIDAKAFLDALKIVLRDRPEFYNEKYVEILVDTIIPTIIESLPDENPEAVKAQAILNKMIPATLETVRTQDADKEFYRCSVCKSTQYIKPGMERCPKCGAYFIDERAVEESDDS